MFPFFALVIYYFSEFRALSRNCSNLHSFRSGNTEQAEAVLDHRGYALYKREPGIGEFFIGRYYPAFLIKPVKKVGAFHKVVRQMVGAVGFGAKFKRVRKETRVFLRALFLREFLKG